MRKHINAYRRLQYGKRGDSAGLGGLVQARDSGEAIPPVVARILSGDSTSPFSRGGKGDGDLLHFAKPAKRSLKGKGDGNSRWIVRFWRGWCEARLVKYFTAWALIIIGLSTE